MLNHGDFTTIGPDQGSVDLIVGGTPCQSFSVAGVRKGMDDARGGLALEFARLVGRCRPRWVVWENVPGVLSSESGRAFGSVIGSLAELGYGLAWRVLDARHFGVPQQRRRVFVVGYRGDWRRASAVLFEPGRLPDSPDLRFYGPALGIPGSGGPDRQPYRLSTRNRDAKNWGCPTQLAYCLTTRGSWSGNQAATLVLDALGARVLTPLECERLMGFPDGWTDIEYKGRPAPIGNRLMSLGNSMAVPVMAWLGRRIEFVDGLFTKKESCT